MTSSVKSERATNHLIGRVSHVGQCYYTQYQLTASCKLCLEDIPSTMLFVLSRVRAAALYPTIKLPERPVITTTRFVVTISSVC